MLLVIDIGNTNLKIGLYSQSKLLGSWRLSVATQKTADEYGMVVIELLNGINVSVNDINGVIISSVVPTLNYTIEHMCKYYFKFQPIIVGPGMKTGLNIKYLNPKDVGSDRIVNCVAARNIYKGNLIVVDFGSATTFSVVNEKGDFLGGVIAPGIKCSADALVNTASKLPRVELDRPEKVIGRTTETNIQSGIIYGFTGMVEYIIRKIKEEAGFDDCKVVATGGLSALIENKNKEIIDIYDKTLTLKGLKILYDMNRQEDL